MSQTKQKIQKILLTLNILQMHAMVKNSIYDYTCHKMKIFTKILHNIQVLQIHVIHRKKYQQFFLPSILCRCMVWIERTQHSMHEHKCHEQEIFTKILPHIQILLIHVIHKMKISKLLVTLNILQIHAMDKNKIQFTYMS